MSADESTSDATAASRRRVVAAVLVSRGDVLAARRSRPPALAGRWEFPGGKVEEGESLQDALRRELREELGVQVQVDAEFEHSQGPWPIDDESEMRVFFATVTQGEPTAGDSHDEVVWLPLQDLDSLEWLPADESIATALAARPHLQPGS